MSVHCCAPAFDTHHARLPRSPVGRARRKSRDVRGRAARRAPYSGSSSLAADALDFLGDSANYAASLGAIALGGLWTSRVAFVKGVVMFGFGVGVLATRAGARCSACRPNRSRWAWSRWPRSVSTSASRTAVRFRKGDANMRSVWLCTRNDVIANIAVSASRRSACSAPGRCGPISRWPRRSRRSASPPAAPSSRTRGPSSHSGDRMNRVAAQRRPRRPARRRCRGALSLVLDCAARAGSRSWSPCWCWCC